MKSIKWFIAVALAFGFFVPVVKGFSFNIDGYADPGYGSPVSVQAIGTSAGDNTETNQGLNCGSELDAAYGVISNGYLYLVLAGNFSSDPSCEGAINDEFHIFFMTNPNGTDHTLGTNYSAYAGGRINAMGVNGGTLANGGPGLTFDNGFTPNYWIGFNVGEPTPPNGTPPLMYADYQVVCSNCQSYDLGNVPATNVPPGNVLLSISNGIASGIELAIITTNIGGVDATTCALNAGGATQSVNAAAVRSGVELAIPLLALGYPTGTVSICTFITDQFCDSIYNQVLGPVWDGTSSYCEGDLAGGVSSEVNFSTLPGQHYFTLPVPPCNAILVNQTIASYGQNGGTSNVTVYVNGESCGWTVTSDSPWLTITSSDSVTGPGSFTYSVATNSSIYAQFGTLTIAGTIVTQTVSVVQNGVALPPLGVVPITGTASPVFGCPLAVQQIGTGFGDNNLGNTAYANGSELDAAYGIVQNHVLFLFLAGDLASNNQLLNLFFMTGPGGTNTLVSGNNTNVSEGRLGFLSGSTNAPAGPGFTFASGFAPNYCIILNGGGTPYQLFADYFQLWPGGTNSSGFATNAYYLGYSEATIDTIITNGTLGGFNPFGIQATINNSNTGGVDGGTSEGVGCTNYYGGGPESAQAALVGTGIELGIPLAAIGNPTGQIAVCAFIANPGEYVSNQFLPPIDPTIANNGTTCWANLTAATNSRAINLNGVPISPYFVVGPEPHITSISITNTNSVAISYLTANNANMFYQLQRATSLTNGATWSQLYPNKPGTNGFAPFTYTDTKAATNKSGMFYRVQQSPACTTP